MNIKTKIINRILEVEGGYVNNPNDSGGETNHGITINVARENGYAGKMVNLTKDIAFEIYEKSFWNKLFLTTISEVSEKIAEEVADTGVNMGVRRAGIFLQRSLTVLNNRGLHYLDLKIDGVIGNKTVTSLKAFINKRGDTGEFVLLNMLNSLQGAFYVQLCERREKDETFIYGWFKNRILMRIP